MTAGYLGVLVNTYYSDQATVSTAGTIEQEVQ